MVYVWQKVAPALGAKRSFMFAMLALALALFPLFFVTTFNGALACALLLGVGIAGFIEVIDLLLSDVIDEDETKTKTRREGMYFGANAFITRFAIALNALTIGFVFMSTGYNPYIFTQTRDFIFGLRLLIVAFPMGGILLALLIIAFYPLVGTSLHQMKARLKEMHNKKGVA